MNDVNNENDVNSVNNANNANNINDQHQALDLKGVQSEEEIIDKLKKDESWESDPEIRKKAIGLLIKEMSNT